MTSLALSFNDVTFNPVAQNDGQIWLTSTELAKALGYSRTDKVSNLYNAHKDEFTSNMTLTLDLGVKGFGNGNSKKAVRIFSLRGCHLLAMFAKTEIAKQFRKWVLDLLDKEVGQPVLTKIETDEKITDKQAYQLKTAVEKRCKNNKEHYQTVWTALKHRFEVPKYTDILVKDFDNAMNLVWTIALPPVLEQSQPDYSQNNALWKTIGLLQYEDVSKTIVLMEALIQQGMVQIKNLKKQRSLIWDALEQQKAPILDPVIRAGLIKQAQDFIAKQNSLKFA
jgi:prophage antirepressor-like protein